MMKRALTGLILISPLSIASEGSWSSQSFGGTMTRGQQVLKSKPVKSPSPLPSGVVASRVHWKIITDGPAPVGLRIRLCSTAHCLMLPGRAGEMSLPVGIPPGGPFQFEYFSSAGGKLNAPFTVLNNQMTVSYKKALPVSQ